MSNFPKAGVSQAYASNEAVEKALDVVIDAIVGQIPDFKIS
jgi:hypothetical protein